MMGAFSLRGDCAMELFAKVAIGAGDVTEIRVVSLDDDGKPQEKQVLLQGFDYAGTLAVISTLSMVHDEAPVTIADSGIAPVLVEALNEVGVKAKYRAKADDAGFQAQVEQFVQNYK
jgi:hypothetical protein